MIHHIMLWPLLCSSFSHVPCFSPPDTCKVQQMIKFQDALQPFPLQAAIQMLHIPLKRQLLPRNWEATRYGIEFTSQKFPLWVDHGYWWATFLARWINYIHLSVESSTRRGCPGKLWNLCSWRFSTPNGTKPWETRFEFSVDPALSRKLD